MKFLNHFAIIAGSFLATCTPSSIAQSLTHRSFVVIIPSYNNISNYKNNLDSLFAQTYQNYRAIYIDAASTDGTYEAVKNYIQEKVTSNKVKLVKNSKRCFPLENIYTTIHEQCFDHEIAVILDGDDQFANNGVLALLNEEYKKHTIWLTFGNFIAQSNKLPCSWSQAVPEQYILTNRFREWPHLPTHLRTFYVWLFKKIAKEDLLYEGQFFDMAGDVAFLLPMMEMAGKHHRFIKEILYIYNDLNPINEHKINQQQQLSINKIVRSKRKYKPLSLSPLNL